MSFLSSNSITDKFFDKYNSDRIKCGAYELSLGNEVFLTNDNNNTKKIYNDGEQISIAPGQFALLITKEIIYMPVDLIGFISIKFSIKLEGLINVSGFHVDPGFNGKLIFSVYNAGSRPIPLTINNPTFLIWFSKLESEEKKYDGEHKTQLEISDNAVRAIQGDVVSPNTLKKLIDETNRELNKKIELLDGKVQNFTLLTITLGSALLVSIIILILTINFKSCAPEPRINYENGKYIEKNKTTTTDTVKSNNQRDSLNYKVK